MVAKSDSLFRSMTFSDMSVGNQPGAIALTWILYMPHLQARSLVKMITPPLLELYPMAEKFGDEPRSPATEAMLMIFPRRCAIMVFPTACENRKVPVRLVSITLFHCSSVIDSTGAPQEVPALLIRMSIRPNRLTVA